METIYPTAIKFHKKSVEMQFALKKPEVVEGGSSAGRRTKPGCVFLEIAKAKEDNSGTMDWANKIIMKLSSGDIATLITSLRKGQPAKLFHKLEREVVQSTTLNVEKGEKEGTYKWFVGKQLGNDKLFANIYLNDADMFLATKMLESALPVIHAWAE